MMPAEVTPAEVARALGFVLSPAQEVYREARRQGMPREVARTWAARNAGQRAQVQTHAVVTYLREHSRVVVELPERGASLLDRVETELASISERQHTLARRRERLQNAATRLRLGECEDLVAAGLADGADR